MIIEPIEALPDMPSRPLHVKNVNKYCFEHNLDYISAAIFKCSVCQAKMVFAQNGKYWDYKANSHLNKASIYELTCEEEQIKNILE